MRERRRAAGVPGGEVTVERDYLLSWVLKAIYESEPLRERFVKGMRTWSFNNAMESGQLSEFNDGEAPHFHDFLEWHGLYKVWLNREQTYRDLLGRQSLPEQLRRVIAAA